MTIDGRLVGVVLAGGRSSRMGEPKEAIRLDDGRTMLEHVAAALEAVCDTVVVAGVPSCDAPWPVIPDRRPGEGPLAGIEAVLASSRGDAYLFCPCDLPRIDAATLAHLVAAGPAPIALLHVRGEERPRPLPARVDASAAPAIRRELDAGSRALHRVFRAIGIDARTIDDGRALHNVNEPGDLDGSW